MESGEESSKVGIGKVEDGVPIGEFRTDRVPRRVTFGTIKGNGNLLRRVGISSSIHSFSRARVYIASMRTHRYLRWQPNFFLFRVGYCFSFDRCLDLFAAGRSLSSILPSQA